MNETKTAGITVVMPAFNAEKTIERAIRSVLAQTYTNLELKIVDDCSTDGTAQLIEACMAEDSRVHVLRNAQNLGVSASRNRGAQEAQFPWIAFLDSDDYWTPDKLEQQMRVLLDHPECALCYTSSAFIDENGVFSDYILRARPRVTYQELLCQNIISCSSVLVRRADLLEHPMCSKELLHEDYAVWLALLKKYPYAVGIDSPMLIYQVSAGSKSGNKLRAAQMQWNTYRHCGVPVLKACRSFAAYSFRNLRKYLEIRRRMCAR